MEIAEILSHAFLQKFRESNGLTKEITKQPDDLTKFFSVREFLVFPHCGVRGTVWKNEKFSLKQIFRRLTL